MKHAALIFSITILFTTLCQNSFSCSAFIAEEDGLILVGNNEDYYNPFTVMHFVKGEEGKLGFVYFGYDDLNPQGGMNEAGLVFDFFATEHYPVKKSLDKPEYQGNLYTKIMEECRTVKEALDVLDQYNLKHMETFMTFLADQKGDAAIVEGDKIIRKSGNYQIVTNFYQSQIPNGVKANGNSQCWRYAQAKIMLRDGTPFNKQKAKDLLSAVSQKGRAKTLYSNIYDVKNQIVYLYHFHDFDHEVVIDLKKELQKEDQGYIEIPKLFPSKPDADEFMEQVKQRMNYRIGNVEVMTIPKETLNQYCHTYRYEDRTVKTLVKDGTLHIDIGNNIHAPLQAYSKTDFFVQLFSYDFIFSFDTDDSNHIKGMWMHQTVYRDNNKSKTTHYFKNVDKNDK